MINYTHNALLTQVSDRVILISVPPLQGVFFPGYYSMAGQWAPVTDRALIDAIQGSGNLNVLAKFM